MSRDPLGGRIVGSADFDVSYRNSCDVKRSQAVYFRLDRS